MNNMQLVFFNNSTILEGPEWNPERRCISCVSILEGCVYIIYEDTGVIHTIDMKSQVGCALWMDRDHLLVASYKGIYKVNVETDEMVYLDNILPRKDVRYNDGAFDKKKRFIVGTTGYNRLAEGENALYSYCDGKAKVLVDGTTISNGIAFSPEADFMYFVDTPTRKVGRYRYDPETGDACFDKYIISIDEGIPDGICVDDAGSLWVAHWGGSQVSKWDLVSGEKMGKIDVPCKNVSSCCIGGQDMSYMYVTTAKHDDGSISEVMAGALFKYRIKEN